MNKNLKNCVSVQIVLLEKRVKKWMKADQEIQ